MMNNQLRDDMATMAHYLRTQAATLPLDVASAWTSIYAVLLRANAPQAEPTEEPSSLTAEQIVDVFRMEFQGTLHLLNNALSAALADRDKWSLKAETIERAVLRHHEGRPDIVAMIFDRAAAIAKARGHE